MVGFVDANVTSPGVKWVAYQLYTKSLIKDHMVAILILVAIAIYFLVVWRKK